MPGIPLFPKDHKAALVTINIKRAEGTLPSQILRLLYLSLSRLEVVTHITRKVTTSKPIKKDIMR